jgi:hypothetical protein
VTGAVAAGVGLLLVLVLRLLSWILGEVGSLSGYHHHHHRTWFAPFGLFSWAQVAAKVHPVDIDSKFRKRHIRDPGEISRLQQRLPYSLGGAYYSSINVCVVLEVPPPFGLSLLRGRQSSWASKNILKW